jgi:hypothetical protein
MSRRIRLLRLQQIFLPATLLLGVMLALIPSQTAFALIEGGEGNGPVPDPGWPNGAAALFNNAGRIAWWEGPPFGGGQWHAECRGDAKGLSAVLADFAKLDVKLKRVIVHDGIGHSFWLNPNREPAKEAIARMDWAFMVWQPTSWEQLRKLPADLNPTDEGDGDQGAPAQIDVYAGGSVHWSDVKVPQGLAVIDQRLEAHGFAPEDKTVLEGTVIDLTSKQPISARVRLERVEPQMKGGYHYTEVAKATADSQGRWVFKKVSTGWLRIVVEADGYVPRVVGYGQFDDQPLWQSYKCGLSRTAPVTGRVTDDAGQPVAEVEVRLQNVASDAGGRYESPDEYVLKTDADGRFHADRVPAGTATIWLHKSGYCRPGLAQRITTPTTDVALKMMKSAQVHVTVNFTRVDRPKGYIVQIEPEGGSGVGTWGGSGNIDDKNQIWFHDVPPGRYVLEGQPNPSSADQHLEPVKIELKGGHTMEVTVSAN